MSEPKFNGVPTQYRPKTKQLTNRICKSATELWPIIEELGDNFSCETDKLVITINKKLVITINKK